MSNATRRVMIRCPASGKVVATKIEVDEKSFAAFNYGTVTSRCPECGGVHKWTKADAFLEVTSS